MKKILTLLALSLLPLLLTACGPTRGSSGWLPARTVLNVVFERRPSRGQIEYRGTNQNAQAVCAKVIAINKQNAVYIDHPVGFVRINPGQTLHFGRVRAISPSYRARWTMRFRVRRNGGNC
jgi:hypothetical protein